MRATTDLEFPKVGGRALSTHLAQSQDLRLDTLSRKTYDAHTNKEICDEMLVIWVALLLGSMFWFAQQWRIMILGPEPEPWERPAADRGCQNPNINVNFNQTCGAGLIAEIAIAAQSPLAGPTSPVNIQVTEITLFAQ